MQKNLRPTAAVERIRNNDATLTGVDLTGNASYEMKCAQYTEEIGHALANNTHLTSLCLSNLGINDNNVIHISDALKVNNTLTMLDLSKNKFGTDGLISLADALRDNKSVTELNVIGQSKDFGEGALSKVIDMLEYNTTLKKIVWRLHSRQSFRINNQLTRNLEIERRLQAGLPIDDIDPYARRNEGHTESHSNVNTETHTTTQSTAPPPTTTQTTTPKTTTPTTTTTTTPKTTTHTTTTTTTPKTTTPTTTTTTTPKTTTPTTTPKTTTPTTNTTTNTTTTTTNTNTPAGSNAPRYDAGRVTWWVENCRNENNLNIEIAEPKQKVYIRGVEDSVVVIVGKATSISIENCKRTGIIFDDVIATVEVVNSQKIQLQANGIIPAVQLDKTHGCTLYIQTDKGLDVNIVTSQCSQINALTPGAKEEDDMVETPLPEQYVTSHDGKKWVTKPSDHSGV